MIRRAVGPGGGERTVQHHSDRGGDGAALDHPIDPYTPRQNLHGLPVAVVLEHSVDAGLLLRRVLRRVLAASSTYAEVRKHGAATVTPRVERQVLGGSCAAGRTEDRRKYLSAYM